MILLWVILVVVVYKIDQTEKVLKIQGRSFLQMSFKYGRYS